MKEGDKVICIDNKNLEAPINHFNKFLEEGAIYHIREIVPGYQFKGQPDGVKLDEIRGSIVKTLCHDDKVRFIETHFKKSRFRVIEELDVQAIEKIRKELITILNHKNE
jgi:hypothetical protein